MQHVTALTLSSRGVVANDNYFTSPISLVKTDVVDRSLLLILRKLLKTQMRPKIPAYTRSAVRRWVAMGVVFASGLLVLGIGLGMLLARVLK
jgi:hypothetical protein